jgi:ABC-2 type transport system permease protein
MSFTRFLAIARKELIQIVRDTRSLGIVLVMPIVLMLLFGYGVSLDFKHIPVYVFDRDSSQRSRDLVKEFQSTQYFDVIRAVDNYADLIAALDSGSAKLGLVIPPDFARTLDDGGATRVQALVDASDDNTANVTLSYTQGILGGFSQNVQLGFLRRQGLSSAVVPLSVDTRTWYNENLESKAFIVPGVLALIMSVIGAFLTSLTIAREWERGTMEQLVSTPVSALEILLGKLTPYFFIGLLDVAICAGFAIFWFQVPFRGSVITLALSSALFMVVVLCLGFLISVIAKNQLAASQIALIATFLPAFLLSGFLFAIEQMPKFVQGVTYIVPARYYISALKKIFLKGSPASQLYGDLLPLAVFALLLATLATRTFHKRLA